MELHCKTERGLNPDLLDKLFGLKSDEQAWLAHLFLNHGDIRNEDAARIFASIIYSLASDHPISFLFPYDMEEVRRKLHSIHVGATKTNRGLMIETHTSDLGLIINILMVTSFTTFYALVNGPKPEKRKVADILNDLESYDFIVVLSIFDDSIEVLSKSVGDKEMEMAINGIRVEEGINTSFETAPNNSFNRSAS